MIGSKVADSIFEWGLLSSNNALFILLPNEITVPYLIFDPIWLGIALKGRGPTIGSGKGIGSAFALKALTPSLSFGLATLSVSCHVLLFLSPLGNDGSGPQSYNGDLSDYKSVFNT